MDEAATGKAFRFEHYQVSIDDQGRPRKLGEGAMGVTYLAEDTNLKVKVALKVIRPNLLGDEEVGQRFQREAQAAARLRHPNVAGVYHLGTVDNTYFYAMEFVEGETVKDRVQRDGPMPVKDALEVTLQVCEALAAAERHKMVHRDIKPANIMIEAGDEDILRAKLIDFGLAKPLQSEAHASMALQTQAGIFLGTPVFASPEQVEDVPTDTRSDFYALGLTLWFMLEGRTPFEGSLHKVLFDQVHTAPPLNRLLWIPAEVRDLLAKLLEKDPKGRPQTARELRQKIHDCLRALATSGTSYSEWQQRFQVGGSPRTQPWGMIYEGQDTLSGAVRLHLLRNDRFSDPKAIQGVLADARRAIDIHHPNVLRHLTVFPTSGAQGAGWMVVTEHPGSETLLDHLRRVKQIPPIETLAIIERLASAVDVCIANDLITADLDPAAIYLKQVPRSEIRALNSSSLSAPPNGDPEVFEAVPKLSPINYSYLTTLRPAEETAVGMTQVQFQMQVKTPQELVQRLALLAYQCMGGSVSGTWARMPRFIPLAVLTQRQNDVLRNAMTVAPWANAGEFVEALNLAKPPRKKEEASSTEPESSSGQATVMLSSWRLLANLAAEDTGEISTEPSDFITGPIVRMDAAAQQPPAAAEPAKPTFSTEPSAADPEPPKETLAEHPTETSPEAAESPAPASEWVAGPAQESIYPTPPSVTAPVSAYLDTQYREESLDRKDPEEPDTAPPGHSEAEFSGETPAPAEPDPEQATVSEPATVATVEREEESPPPVKPSAAASSFNTEKVSTTSTSPTLGGSTLAQRIQLISRRQDVVLPATPPPPSSPPPPPVAEEKPSTQGLPLGTRLAARHPEIQQSQRVQVPEPPVMPPSWAPEREAPLHSHPAEEERTEVHLSARPVWLVPAAVVATVALLGFGLFLFLKREPGPNPTPVPPVDPIAKKVEPSPTPPAPTLADLLASAGEAADRGDAAELATLWDKIGTDFPDESWSANAGAPDFRKKLVAAYLENKLGESVAIARRYHDVFLTHANAEEPDLALLSRLCTDLAGAGDAALAEPFEREWLTTLANNSSYAKERLEVAVLLEKRRRETGVATLAREILSRDLEPVVGALERNPRDISESELLRNALPALKPHLKAIEQAGVPEAGYILGDEAIRARQYDTAEEYYARAAQKSHVPSMRRYSMVLTNKRPPEIKEARQWLNQAVEKGDNLAKVFLADVCLPATPSASWPREPERAYQLLKEAADAGIWDAHYRLGATLLSTPADKSATGFAPDLKVPERTKQAEDHLRKAVEGKLPAAYLMLVQLLLSKGQIKEGVELLEEGAALSPPDPYCMYWLSLVYSSFPMKLPVSADDLAAAGVRPNPEKSHQLNVEAVKMLRIAVKGGDPFAISFCEQAGIFK